MTIKSNLDNHANQLNPNNKEYWNSRGLPNVKPAGIFDKTLSTIIPATIYRPLDGVGWSIGFNSRLDIDSLPVSPTSREEIIRHNFNINECRFTFNMFSGMYSLVETPDNIGD